MKRVASTPRRLIVSTTMVFVLAGSLPLGGQAYLALPKMAGIVLLGGIVAGSWWSSLLMPTALLIGMWLGDLVRYDNSPATRPDDINAVGGLVLGLFLYTALGVATGLGALISKTVGWWMTGGRAPSK